jgi:hypothetical protein
MAFNPFEAFRKNSKPLMAALTIFVMFIFVLSYGSGGVGGDFFDWVARELGAKDRRGPVLGSIDGEEYRSQTLHDIRQRRQLANAFMSAAVRTVDQTIATNIDRDIQENKIKDQDAVALVEAIFMYRNPQTRFLFQMPPQQAMSLMGSFLREKPKVARELFPLFGISAGEAYDYFQGRLAQYMTQNKENEKQAEFRALRGMSRILKDEVRQMQVRDEGMYFEAPNKNQEEALQFAMYLHLADTMGIKFVDNDIKKLITDETGGYLTPQDVDRIDRAIRRNDRGISTERLLQAIGDEFRVRTVLKVMFGSTYSGQPSNPIALTPLELYDFYKDRCAEITYQIVDVPVEPFLAQVKAEPTPQELESFFKKYNKDEADPSREKPGFKEPRKVKLQFVAIDASKPIYKDVIPYLRAASTLASASAAGCPGIGGALNAVDPLLAPTLEALDDKKTAIDEHRSAGPPFPYTDRPFRVLSPAGEWLERAADSLRANPFFAAVGLPIAVQGAVPLLPVRDLTYLRMRDSTIFNDRRTPLDALPFASLVGQLIVPVNPIANATQAFLGYRDAAELVEMRDRVAYGVQLIATPLSPMLSMAGGSLAPWAIAMTNLPPDPIGVYMMEVVAEREKTRAARIANLDLDAFEKKLADFHKDLEIIEPAKPEDSAKKEPKYDMPKVERAMADARVYVEGWLKSHDYLKTGKSALLDKFKLADDPELASAFEELRRRAERPGAPPNAFANELESMFFDSRRDPNTEFAKFKPQRLSDGVAGQADASKPYYVAWKVDDRKPEEYKFDTMPAEMLKEVKKAWKMQKARELAKAAADAFVASASALAQKELREAHAPGAFVSGLIDLASKSNYTVIFPSLRLAKLGKAPSLNPRQPGQYERPKITDKQILYPPTQNPGRPGDLMADQLLEMRSQPAGASQVIANQPKTHYYVAFMIDKQQLSVDDFWSVYVKSNASADNDPLYQIAMMEIGRQAFRTDVIDRLKAETKFTETEELKKESEKPTEAPE